MPPLTNDLQAPPKNGRPRPLKEDGANGHTNALDVVEEFQGPGFRFVRAFLLVILLLVGILLALAGFLSWYFSMDVTVEGKGVIEPQHRYLVKAEIAGIIKQIHVQTGQQVQAGDLLVSLDDTEWRAELAKVEVDLEVNQSRVREIEVAMQQERTIRQAEVTQAGLEVERMRLELERVVAEQTLYSNGTSLHRKPIEELVPVRLTQAMLNQREAGLALVQQRLRIVSEPSQEIVTIEKLRERLVQDRFQLQHWLERSRILARASGSVLTANLHHRLGDRLQAGETILEMAGMEIWQARIAISEVDIPKVKVGQAVHLYVEAFPHMKYKIFKGHMKEVPALPVTGISPSLTATYPVEVSIEDPQVVEGDRVYSLAYGMNVDAKIVVDCGRILTLMIEKLLSTIDKTSRHGINPYREEIEEVSAPDKGNS